RKVSGVPQLAQKSRCASDELAKLAGVPRAQAKSLRCTGADAANGPPTAFWHIRQWHRCTRSGGPLIAYRTAPHWQPPVSLGVSAISPISDPPLLAPYMAHRPRFRIADG